jgi:Putative transmembrane protein (PGPGW)
MNRVTTVGATLVGWALLAAGVAALVLPGPGLLLLLAGLLVLSRRYEWARRAVDPVRERAMGVAGSSVETLPRALLSGLGALALIAAGVVWWIDPRIPRFWIFGPRLPLAGWEAGCGLIVSGLVALGLIVYSWLNFRTPLDVAPTQRQDQPHR